MNKDDHTYREGLLSTLTDSNNISEFHASGYFKKLTTQILDKGNPIDGRFSHSQNFVSTMILPLKSCEDDHINLLDHLEIVKFDPYGYMTSAKIYR